MQGPRIPTHQHPASDLLGLRWVMTDIIHSEHVGTPVHSNPGTVYTAWDSDAAGAAYASFLIPEGCTHARLIGTFQGNEAGNSKGVQITVNGVAVAATWNGNGRTDINTGWVYLPASPTTTTQGVLYVKGSSATEDMTMMIFGVAFKRDSR